MAMKWWILSLGILIVILSCSTSAPGLFGKTDLHTQYGKKLSDAGLKGTALGSEWFAQATAALNAPYPITIPYKETGYFAMERPRAVGLKFPVRRGQKISMQVIKNSSTPFMLFVDLWRVDEQGKSSMISSMDTLKNVINYEADKDINLILRIQPELLKSGGYTLSIATGPSLNFPVAGKVSSIGSFWGDARDNGGRRHEGIDIFAPKGTPAIAAANGTVTSVTENNLGGKVIFMRPEGKDFTLYYAHLGQQLVTTGQQVNAGDTLGTIDNTGNARNTPAHLHFGIYSFGGAVDPLPFVDPARKDPPPIVVETQRLTQPLRLSGDRTLGGNKYERNTIIIPLAATSDNYRVQLPDGTVVEVRGKDVQLADNQKIVYVNKRVLVFELPLLTAPGKYELKEHAPVRVLGSFKNFSYIETSDDIRGWIPSDAI
jgi:murein DD-endopeptidase MepM/ murein hydrolase activator NlpD